MACSLLRRRLPYFAASPGMHNMEQNYDSFQNLWFAIRHFGSFASVRKLDLTDLTCPHTWYPNARRKKRKVFLHVGPTNSGKTYNALKRLETSPSGIYCGPLRLLAWEVANRLNKANVPCDLITGQEREEKEGAKHSSVTVEMADVNSEYHCAVIDEIQMMSCRTRGFSFTRALLGISSDELHVCGDAAAVPLVQDVLEVTGDIVQVQYYDRLSPLIPLKTPLGSFSNIQTGDCVVTFSRQGIYKLKASMFNDESSEFDVLVASDAIGMGLNLNISRIIFSTMKKFDGIERRELTVPEIKQIAGRAGRYGSKFPVGKVTCIDADDLPLLHSSLEAPSPVLEHAGLLPTFDLLSLYSHVHSTANFYPILEQFLEKAKLSPNYFIADCEEILVLDLYVWLSFRMEDSFPDRQLASSQKAICSLLIEQFLEGYGGKITMPRRHITCPKQDSLVSPTIDQLFLEDLAMQMGEKAF